MIPPLCLGGNIARAWGWPPQYITIRTSSATTTAAVHAIESERNKVSRDIFCPCFCPCLKNEAVWCRRPQLTWERRFQYRGKDGAPSTCTFDLSQRSESPRNERRCRATAHRGAAAYYPAISQAAATHTAVIATDIAIAVAMSLTHSRIDIVQFRPIPSQQSMRSGHGASS
jgi:hypothetical protein